MLFLAIIGGVVGIGALMVGGYLWRGYVLSILWGWFAVPIFHLPRLSIASAIGISIVVGFLTYQTPEDVEKPDRTQVHVWTRAVILVTLLPAISLGVGWVVHMFVTQ